MEKTARRARRQRIPAFGEWNYAYAGDWPVTQYFESGMQMQMQAGRLVMAIPIPPSPPPKPANKVVKWRESATATLELDDEDQDDKKKKQQQQQHVVVRLDEQGGAVKKQGPVAAAHAYKASRAAAAAVKAMDQDLYHIPPDMLCHEPRKRLTRRSLWMGCLGLNCVA